jgi:dTDP-4-amino-4,6-dideoxygalactose transaminase
MKIPLLDIKRQIDPIRDEIDRAIKAVVDNTQFILGPDVSAFESDIAAFCGTDHAIGVASGTDALIIALKALGVSEGDEVITTPYSFFATASCIWRIGAKPVFADIDPETFNFSTDRVADAITPKTKAVLAVHLFGQTVDMTTLSDVVKSIPIVEDAAQALGASWKSRHAGNLGKLGCFSFFPSKNLGGFGDGGMITTSDEDLAQRCRALRVHGALRTYIHEDVGLNSRLDSLQAAVLKVKLPYLDTWCEERRRNAGLYRRYFEGSSAVTPTILPDAVPIYNQYVIRVPERDALRKRLADKGIGSAVYYPLPLHLQPCFKSLNYCEGDFPESEKAAKETIALPIFSELTEDEIKQTADVILEHIKQVS